MKGASKAELGAEVTSYVRSHGVFVEEAVLAGTTLKIDTAANNAFYGKEKFDIGEIFAGKSLKSSDELTTLQKALTEYATRE
jgi:lipid-binding SYLF domain-containing protein